MTQTTPGDKILGTLDSPDGIDLHTVKVAKQLEDPTGRSWRLNASKSLACNGQSSSGGKRNRSYDYELVS
jgi:hypothetical protein